MLNSISYVELSCRYNREGLKRFSGFQSCEGGGCLFVFRGRSYRFAYVSDEDEFRIFNSRGLLVGCLVGDVFQYYVSSAPEIGFYNVFALLAVLNVFPIKSC